MRDGRTGVYFGVSASGHPVRRHDVQRRLARRHLEPGVGQRGQPRRARAGRSRCAFPCRSCGSTPPRAGAGASTCERIIERKHEFALLAITPRAESGFVSRFVELAGVEAVQAAAAAAGAGPLRQRQDRVAHARRRRSVRRPGRLSGRAGLDLKLGLGGNFTLDGSDQPGLRPGRGGPGGHQPERRRDVLPGEADLLHRGVEHLWNDFGRGGARDNWNFNYGNPLLFYSRRVGRTPQGDLPEDHDHATCPTPPNILGAAKLTGEHGAWSVGTLHARDVAKEVAEVSTAGNVTAAAGRAAELLRPGARAAHVRRRALRGGAAGHGGGARAVRSGAAAQQFNDRALLAALDGWTQLGDERTYALTGWWAASRVDGIAGTDRRTSSAAASATCSGPTPTTWASIPRAPR